MQASSAIVTEAAQRLLKNGVRLALLSQKKIKKACISISINRGHFHSLGYPDGFAHLLEHMLFSASKQYAQADALDQHLFEFNGQVNGWTQDLSTHFTMQCELEGFTKACTMLVDRLARPLFLAEHINAELIAIDAEFKSKKKQVIRQLLSVQRATSNPEHPFSRFSTGNLSSLLALDDVVDECMPDNRNSEPSNEKPLTKTHLISKAQLTSIKQKLHAYHQKIVQGKYISVAIGIPSDGIVIINYEHIANLIETAFSHSLVMPNDENLTVAESSNNDLFLLNTPVFRKHDLNTFIQIEAQQKEHQLLFSYQVAGIDTNARDSLFIMLTHTIESKHQGGLFDTLVNQQLIEDLQASYNAIVPYTDELVISLRLSDKGRQNITQVQSIVNAFLDNLKSEPLEDWRYREKHQQYQLQASLQRPAGLFENCINVSQQLHQKTAAACLQESEFDSQLAKQAMPIALKALRQDNLRLYFLSPLAHTSHVTEHYEAKYAIATLADIAQPVQLSFAKVRQNPFMTSQHPLVMNEVEPTELQQYRAKGAELKFYQDTRFSKPNGECYMSITDSRMFGNAQQVAIKRVWLACLQQSLARQFFDIDLASIHFRVYAHQHGISIHTGGLSERQLLLCIELINAIRAFKADVATIKEKINACINNLASIVDQTPFNRLFSHLNEFYQDTSKSNKAVLSALKVLSAEDVSVCQADYFSDNYVECLLVGNWTLNSTKRFFQQVVKRFPAKLMLAKPSNNEQKSLHTQHIHFTQDALEGCNLIRHYIPVLNASEINQALSQKHFALKLSARSLVLEKLLSGHVFDTLRQKHKMGYTLGVGYKPIGGFPGVAIYITSPTHSTEEVFQGMDEAIQNAASEFNKKPSMLKHLVRDLINQVSPKEADISQTTNRIWMHYEDENPALSYQYLIDALRDLTEAEINQALQTFIQNQIGQLVLTQSPSIKHKKAAEPANTEQVAALTIQAKLS